MQSREKELSLISMIESGQIDSVLLLLFDGVSANSCDINGTSALIKAIESQSEHQLDIIKLLLVYNADVNQQGEAHMIPLLRALARQDRRIIQVLLDAGANLNQRILEARNNTLLMQAMHKNAYNTAKTLIELGATLTIADSDGNTALHLAIQASQDDLVELLLKKASPDLLAYVNRRGQTALFVAAVLQEDKEMVERLLAAGAPDLPNQNGITAEVATSDNDIRVLMRKRREAAELRSLPHLVAQLSTLLNDLKQADIPANAAHLTAVSAHMPTLFGEKKKEPEKRVVTKSHGVRSTLS